MAERTAPAAQDERPDLAAMVVPLGRALMAAEAPILEERGLSMWAYVVLSALARGDAPTQAALAASIGADKTRIIGVLDDLQSRELVERRASPTDRRSYALSLTPAGRRLWSTTRAAIRRSENKMLDRLDPDDRRTFLRALATMAAIARRTSSS